MFAIQMFFDTSPAEVWENDGGESWMTAEAVGRCLGYSDARNSINRLVKKNEIEFAGLRVAVKTTATDGKDYETWVYNQDGIFLIACLARTDRAVAFRRWLREYFTSPSGGHAQLVSTIQTPALALERQSTAMASMASAAGSILAQAPDPRQIALPFRTAERIEAVEEAPARSVRTEPTYGIGALERLCSLWLRYDALFRKGEHPCSITTCIHSSISDQRPRSGSPVRPAASSGSSSALGEAPGSRSTLKRHHAQRISGSGYAPRRIAGASFSSSQTSKRKRQS